MDKKSTFSKKLQREHQKEQDLKNKTLVDKVSKPDDIFTVTTKESTRDFFNPSTKKPSNAVNLTRTTSKSLKKNVPLDNLPSPNEYMDHS